MGLSKIRRFEGGEHVPSQVAYEIVGAVTTNECIVAGEAVEIVVADGPIQPVGDHRSNDPFVRAGAIYVLDERHRVRADLSAVVLGSFGGKGRASSEDVGLARRVVFNRESVGRRAGIIGVDTYPAIDNVIAVERSD